jgi:hypothetical protein
MQRRCRGDTRERDDTRKYRDSASSIHKGLQATESSGPEIMRREVSEYREQVLRLYPDMEFDGRAGEGEREWCCCGVM